MEMGVHVLRQSQNADSESTTFFTMVCDQCRHRMFFLWLKNTNHTWIKTPSADHQLASYHQQSANLQLATVNVQKKTAASHIGSRAFRARSLPPKRSRNAARGHPAGCPRCSRWTAQRGTNGAALCHSADAWGWMSHLLVNSTSKLAVAVPDFPQSLLYNDTMITDNSKMVMLVMLMVDIIDNNNVIVVIITCHHQYHHYRRCVPCWAHAATSALIWI